jgi:hypothetical protein
MRIGAQVLQYTSLYANFIAFVIPVTMAVSGLWEGINIRDIKQRSTGVRQEK